MKIITFLAKGGMAEVVVSNRVSLCAVVSLLNARGVGFKVATPAGIVTQEQLGFGGVESWQPPDGKYGNNYIED